MTAPQQAWLGEDVEDDEALLRVQAIGQWRPESTASRRRSSNSGAAWLGFGLAGEAEREREGKPREPGERARGDLILERLGSGWTETPSARGGSTARSLQLEGGR